MRRLLFCLSLALIPGSSLSAQGERKISVPLTEGKVSLLRLTRALLTEYGYAGDQVAFRDVQVSVRGAGGLILLEGLSQALSGAATFHRRDRGRSLEVRIDPARARVLRHKSKNRFAKAVSLLVGKNILERQYALSVPAGLGAGETWVLCVHGVESRPGAFADLRAFLHGQHQPIKTGTFAYANDEAIDRIGKQLARRLAERRRSLPDQRIIIIAHSMGGLVSRFMLETPGLDPGNVATLIMLGTPNHGSHLARLRSGLDLLNFLERHGDKPRVLRPFLDGLGEAGWDLTPGSPFLVDLNRRQRNPRVRYHLVLGNKGAVSADRWQKLQARSLERVQRLRRHELYEEKLRTYLADLDEVVHGKGDGVVSLRRGRLAGVETLVVPITHLALLRRPAGKPDQAAFRAVARWIAASR